MGHFDILEGHKYMNLTSFYEDGRDVATPVWFAREGETLYVVTDASSYKVKRIRTTPRVTVQPCDARGNPLDGGPTVEGQATLHPPDSEIGQRGNKLLNKKYFLKFFFDLLGKIRGGDRVFITVEPPG